MTVRGLPPDIVTNILQFLGGKTIDYRCFYKRYKDRRPLQLSKRELGACSLTCRAWAVRLRGVLFAKLTLRSREDVSPFFSLCTSSFAGRRTGPLVQALELHQDLASLSWIHLVTVFAPRHLVPNLRFLHVVLHDSRNASGQYNPLPSGSPYPGLPRSFPWRACKYATLHISLKNLCIRRPADLLPLVDFRLHDKLFVGGPRTLSLSSVQFYGSTSASELKVGGKLGQQNRNGVLWPNEIIDCPVVWPLVWLFVTAPSLARKVHDPRLIYIAPAQLRTVTALVEDTLDKCRCIICGSTVALRQCMIEPVPGRT